MSTRSGGELVVAHCLAEGVRRIFCVPGESYLAVMDALYDVRDEMELVSCRHESGAAMMAVASGHLSGEPGVAFVTRGPGATNASIAVHIAKQASIPLVLGVGQVSRDNLGRESFQEVDYTAYFAPLAKSVRQLDDPNDIPAAMAEAFDTARSGRQGPVVIAFPEDVLRTQSTAADCGVRQPAPMTIRQDDKQALASAIQSAERPLFVVGGGPWAPQACAALQTFAGDNNMPVMSAFRRADIFDNTHDSYGGFLGYGCAPSARDVAAAADCVIAFGARLDEPTTDGYLFPQPTQRLVHIHPEAAQLGKNFESELSIASSVNEVATALAEIELRANSSWGNWCQRVRQQFIDSELSPPASSPLDLGRVMQILNDTLPLDSIFTTDAGNFTAWPLRYRRYTRPGRLIAPVNGAMGYGVPAAIAASLAHPDRCVIGCVGDGGMLMTGMEIATALQYGAKPILLVFNNSRYGTIAMHQQRNYPGREIGNALQNPDFSAFARSFGAVGIQVHNTGEFPSALDEARHAERLALIELITD